MSTLHVRNVPDALYELLRERAAANERSIGAEVVMLLEGQLSTDLGAPAAPRPARRRAFPGFERFAPPARNVIAAAQSEARELGSAALGTGHLLLAIMSEQASVESVALGVAGLEYRAVRALVESRSETNDASAGPRMPFDQSAKRALELAFRECIEHRDSQIGREHILVGIAREAEGLGAAILREAGEDAATLRAALGLSDRRGMADTRSDVHEAEGPSWKEVLAGSVLRVGDGFRVIELTGKAEDWERQLNLHAARGHRLVEIVERRAIFRVAAP
ncbi:MAG TPA: Clp protease N-terminal domain-containing protein [Gaiellaceae bacterium]